jgi:hypothetical protein
MALTDPQTVTISGTPITLPRTYAQGSESKYTSSDGLVSLSVNHTLAKQGRERHLIRIDHSKLTANPNIPAENVKVSMAAYTVFDIPPAGYTDAEALAAWVGFNTLLTASTNALVTKVLGGES